MAVLFRITMVFVGYVWACVAASLVLALATLTPQWDSFFDALGLQSPHAQSVAMWIVVGLGALVIFAVGFLPVLLIVIVTEGFALRSVVIYGVIGAALAMVMVYGLDFAGYVGAPRQRFDARTRSLCRRRHCRRAGLLAVRRPACRRVEIDRMNRIGLTIALAIGFVVGVICAVDPQLDLDLARIAFDPKANCSASTRNPGCSIRADGGAVLITLLVLPGFLAIIGKLILPHRRMLIEGRAAIFLIATLALGPGLLTNVVLKDHWHRARPIDVQQFGGTGHFTPWWDPRGDCPDNCSFIAGEPSGAFWTMAPAALAPPQLRLARLWRLRSFSARASVCCAWAPARISSPTSCSPACSCIWWYGPRTA